MWHKRNRYKKKENPYLYHAYQRYEAHAANCFNRKDRNGNPVEMKLTFDEWWAIWQESGKWEQRGRHSDSYVMARINDIGHYEIGNVEIITKAENTSRYNTYANQFRRGRKYREYYCPHCKEAIRGSIPSRDYTGA